jgi:MFS family permease
MSEPAAAGQPTSSQSAGRRGAFPALAVADFVSVAGSEISALAIPWFVLTTTDSAARTGLALAAEFVGIIAFGVPAGELVSRFGARRTMLLSDAVRGVLIALVPILHVAGALSFPLLLVILIAVGAFFPAYGAATELVLTAIVGQDAAVLTRANGILGSLNEAGSLLGPAIGGILIALTSATTVLAIDAATYAVALALAMTFVRPGRVVAVEGAPKEAAGLLAGVRRLFGDAWLRSVSIAVAVMELAWTGMTAALPVLAFRGFSENVHLAGWFLAAFGGGSMIGGLLSGRIVPRFGIGRTAVGSYLGVASALWVLATTPPAWLVILSVAVNGVCTGVFMPALFAEMTLRTPPPLRAKTIAAANVVFSATGPLGFIGAGYLLQHTVGTRPAFVAIALAGSVAAAIVVAGPAATRYATVDEESGPSVSEGESSKAT